MSWSILAAEELSHHAAAWDTLQRDSTNTPFLETAFLLPLLEIFGRGQERLALCHSGERLVCAALVCPAGRGMWQTFQPSQLPLGAWIGPACEELGTQMQALVRALPGLALGLGATQIDARLQPRPADGAALRTLDYIDSSYIDMSGSWDEFWAARGKNLRQNTRKAHSKLAADGQVVKLEELRDPADVAEALSDYGALEAAGWKAGGGTAITAANDQGRFYTRMLQNFCALGRGRIVRYLFDQKVVAMDLCIDNGPVVVILKTAYDEHFRNLSPSTLMRHDEFRAWWAEGRYRRVEFYGKTLEWHTRWTEQETQLYHVNAYRWPLLRRLHERLSVASHRPEQGNALRPERSPEHKAEQPG